MKITGNVYSQPYAAPKVGFKGEKQVKLLTRYLKTNPLRIKEFAQNGLFDGVTEQELKSKVVIDAFEKAIKNTIIPGEDTIIRKAYDILMRPFLQK